jgi:hypothetical protein
MNKRLLKKLTKQLSNIQNNTDEKLSEVQAFTHLIVKECKWIILDMMSNNQGDSNTLDLSLTLINDHFGIEDDT